MSSINRQLFDKRMEKLQELPQKVVDETYPFYKKTTPKKGGNARDKTRQNKLQIKSEYGYAGRLDEGWSKQAPKGFTSPSIDFMERMFKKLLGRI